MLKVLCNVLWTVWQWLLSLLPDCMVEPIPTGGGYSVPTPGSGDTNTTAGEPEGPPDAPPPLPPEREPQDVPNSRGALAVPLYGTQPEPVKEPDRKPAPEQEPKPQPPKRKHTSLKPKENDRSKRRDGGRDGRE